MAPPSSRSIWALTVAAIAHFGSAQQLTGILSCGVSGISSTLSFDGSTWLSTPAPLRVRNRGAWVTNLTLLATDDTQGTDGLGVYTSTSCTYAALSAPTTPLITVSLSTYSAPLASPGSFLLRFTHTFPTGLSDTAHTPSTKSAYSTISNWPSYTAGGATHLPTVLTWRDAFVAPSAAWSDALGQLGGVAVLFDGGAVGGTAVVVSPLDHFLSASLADEVGGAGCAPGSPTCWAAGESSYVEAVPPGHSASWVLVAGAEGVTGAVAAWGAVMRGYYAATADKLADTSLTTLGYNTDNGAQLVFGCHEALDACLLDEKAHLDADGVPIRWLSFQNAWWEAGAESAPWCIGSWQPAPGKVPMGVAAFQQALGLPLQLYAPYFCTGPPSPYALGGNWSMARSNTSLPGCNGMDFYLPTPEDSFSFYSFLFDLGLSYGMRLFEPDFLNAAHTCRPDLLRAVGAAEGFFAGQADAAALRGIPIQWCFATPLLVLWSLNAPTITNFRVSYDYYYGGSYDIGTSSLIVWATGAAPSKDTFWTSDNGNQSTTRGGCDKTGCPPDHSNAGALLHTMLALLSTGPVAFSDAPGETNVSLILRTCDAGGNLLQPSKPVTSVDSTFDTRAGRAPAGGFVLGSYTSVDGGGAADGVAHARYIVSHSLTAPYSLRGVDLWPRLSPTASYLVVDWAALQPCVPGGGACPLGVVVPGPPSPDTVLASLPQAPPGNASFTPSLTILTPLCVSGYTLVGEVDKFATVSVQRFPRAVCTPTGVGFGVVGEPGEGVLLGVGGAGGVVVVRITLPTDKGARPRVECVGGAAGVTCA